MTASPPTVRISTPAQIVAAVPYLLGYHPTDSLVILAVKDRRVSFLTRCDLPEDRTVEDVFDTMVPALSRADPDVAVVVAFTEVDGRDVHETVQTMADLLSELGIRVSDQLVVTGTRWRTVPSRVQPHASGDLDVDADAGLVRAEFVAAGAAPLASRADLAALLKPRPQSKVVAELLSSEDEVTGPLDVAGRFAASWPIVLDASDDAAPLTPEVAADAIASLPDTQLRDLLIAWLTPGTLDLDTFPAASRRLLPKAEPPGHDPESEASIGARRLGRLMELARTTPNTQAAPVLTVLASYAWWRGDGALARLALDRALHCEPDYRLATLLDVMVSQGIRPVA